MGKHFTPLIAYFAGQMPLHRIANFLRHRDRRPTSVHQPREDNGNELQPKEVPKFRSDITRICETCKKIDLASMLPHAANFSDGPTRYVLGSLPEIQAKSGVCQLCRAWLQLLPKVETRAGQDYISQRLFSLVRSTTFVNGDFEIGDDRLRPVKLWIHDTVTGFRGLTFMFIVNDGSFCLKCDNIRWNEISLQVDFSLPLSWMKFCAENHKTCGLNRALQMEPVLSLLRLIDCDRTLASRELHVISPDKPLPYAALSYVWGAEQLEDGPSEEAKSGCRTSKPKYYFLIMVAEDDNLRLQS